MAVERRLQFLGKIVKKSPMRKGQEFRAAEGKNAGKSLKERLIHRLESHSDEHGAYDVVTVRVFSGSTIGVRRESVYPRTEGMPIAYGIDVVPTPQFEPFDREEIDDVRIRRRIPGFTTLFKYQPVYQTTPDGEWGPTQDQLPMQVE